MKLSYLIRIFSILFATILFISPVNADFQDGWNAYTNQDFKTAAKNNMLYNIINRPENAIKIGARKIEETSFCPKITAITNR